MIELGRNAKEHHYAIGKKCAHSCDTIFLTNRNYLRQIKKGIRDEKGTCTVMYSSPRKISQQLSVVAKKGDIILFCGKGHEQSMNYNGKEKPWSEHNVVKEALEKKI
jgi:UDP-N-acetylmuramyl tripeptide synthase